MRREKTDILTQFSSGTEISTQIDFYKLFDEKTIRLDIINFQ